MHPLIRFVVYPLFVCFSGLCVFAGNGTVKPVSPVGIEADQIKELNKFLSGSQTNLHNSDLPEVQPGQSAGRICSCQILDLSSSNYNHRYVVLLAEKTMNADGSDYKIAKSRIQKEKKHMKKLFYDKISTVAERQGNGSCRSLFFKLKTADPRLQLYEILNADIH